MNLTLQQLFGVNSMQDSQTLIIKKSDLLLLTPTATNTAESLLVAILLKALDNFTDEIRDNNDQPILDSNNEPILHNGELFTQLSIFRWNNQVVKKNNLLFIRKNLIVETYENAQI